jgi:hypothetical protein
VAISQLLITFQENPQAATDILKRLTVKSSDLFKSFHSSKKIGEFWQLHDKTEKKSRTLSAHLESTDLIY